MLPLQSSSCIPAQQSSVVNLDGRSKRKQEDDHDIDPIAKIAKNTIQNIFTGFVMGRQLGFQLQVKLLKHSEYIRSHSPFSPSEALFQLSIKNISNKTFSVTKINVDRLRFISLYPIKNGDSKLIAIFNCDQLSSIIRIYHPHTMSVENEVTVRGIVTKILSYTGNNIIFSFGRWLLRGVGFYDFSEKDEGVKEWLNPYGRSYERYFGFDNRAFKVTRDNIYEKKFPNSEHSELIDPNHIAEFTFCASSSYLVRASGNEIRITSLNDTEKRSTIDIDLLINNWHSSSSVVEALAQTEGRSIVQKKLKCDSGTNASCNDSNTSSSSSSSSSSSLCPTTIVRSILALHLDQQMLYFGTIVGKEKTEIGVIDLNSGSLVNLFLPKPLNGIMKELETLFVCKERRWLCYSDTSKKIGVIDLKTGISTYLGSHENSLAVKDDEARGFDVYGDLMVSIGERDFKIYNLRTKKEIYSFRNSVDRPVEPYFCDGELIFCEGRFQTIIKYNFLVPKSASNEIAELKERS